MCKATITVKHVTNTIDSVTKLFRAMKRHYKMFVAMFNDMKIKHSHVIDHNSAQWLSTEIQLRQVRDFKNKSSSAI